MKSLMIILFLLLTSVPVGAQDYLPLEPGNFWSYLLEDGGQELRVVGAPVPLFGVMVYPIGHPGMDPFQNLVNYWTTGPDGDLLLHGFNRGTFGYLYNPPIQFLDSPLEVGKTWGSTTDFYTATDTTYVDTFEFYYTVLEQADITVPAGTFNCFGIGSIEGPVLELFGGRYNVLGEEIGSSSRSVLRWYSEDVGVVEEYIDQTYRLETYFDHQVAAVPSSWGGVKALFR